MFMSTTTWPYIQLDAEGVPYLAGTRIKVLQLALDHVAYAWDAEQLHRQHPHLSLAQIYAALGYYHENQEECDRLIEEQQRQADELYEKLRSPQLEAKLQSLKQGS
jgi:uncharacterized protein (DUF433 family)